MRRFVAFIVVFTILTSLIAIFLLSSCSSNESNNYDDQSAFPPEEILYLGGASILNKFSVYGGPYSESANKEIIIFVPFQLIKEGFNGVVMGIKEDGTQDNLLQTDDFEPGTYITLTKEEYAPYSRLILMLDYSWAGTLMSMRTIDLYTLDEQSSISNELNLKNE